MKGLFKLNAKDFAKFKPTDKHTINPGPAVTATPSISDRSLPLSLIALFTIKSIFSICDLAANSGTTPPNSLWTSIWLETTFDNILGIVPIFYSITAAAVSSQLVSIPRINVFFFIIFFNNNTIQL